MNKLRSFVAGVMLALSLFGVMAVAPPLSGSAHAGTFFSCSHAYSLSNSQSLHAITKKAHWPGVKAAHKVGGILSYTGAYVTILDQVFTKTSSFDLTWDHYNTYTKICPR